MARSGVYKSEVDKARKQLIAQGKIPSVARIREVLGGTGSFATLQKHLKELEAEDPAGNASKYPVSDAVAELASRLSGRLQEEAQETIAHAKAQFEAELAQRDRELAGAKDETRALRDQVQHLETTLHGERSDHAATREQLIQAQTTIRQLEERIAGLTVRLGEHEAHAKSLETKHAQAREALEHFRSATKEQRDQDQRRHEHQVQGLELQLRQANETLAAKNEDVLRLNRDNARLVEQTGQHDKELRQLRAELRERDHELEAARPLVAEHKALQTRCLLAEQEITKLQQEIGRLGAQLHEEQDARARADVAAEAAKTRVVTMDELLAKLTAVAAKTAVDVQRSAAATPPR